MYEYIITGKITGLTYVVYAGTKDECERKMAAGNQHVGSGYLTRQVRRATKTTK